ncbi:CubicO group peptidase (beta-lactamase class C family) [Amycolatopsis umgeniensis]|uniref:CubicO group peptidase (Beta-lactamase class C family) n=1 Tax=Amycolatopsis umgeniensis TaxID=336628 RepID=A0A841B207_9PSEU|nr:CubicO group peptidase (beta-lactamase class C family) [Amycolatopsis umgeniensis]
MRQLLNHTAGFAHDPAGAKTKPDGTYDLAALVHAAMDDKPLSARNGVPLLQYRLPRPRPADRETHGPVRRRRDHRADRQTARAHRNLVPAPGKRTLTNPYLPGYVGFRVGDGFFWWEATTSKELSFWSSSAAMESTLADLAKFNRALVAGEVVSPKALAEMRTVVPWTPGSPTGYGLGQFNLQLSCGGMAWGHDGLLPTGHTSLTMATDDGRFASVVTNTNILPTEPGILDVANAALCEGK